MLLGEILIRAGLLDDAGFQRALDEQRTWGGHIGRHLVALGLISEETLVRALSTQCKLPAVALDPARIDPRVGRLVPQSLSERHNLICFGFDERRRHVDVAMADPCTPEIIDEVAQVTRCSVRPYFAAPSVIDRAIALVFHRRTEASGEISSRARGAAGETDVGRGMRGSAEKQVASGESARTNAAEAPRLRPVDRRVVSEAERRPERLAKAVAPVYVPPPADDALENVPPPLPISLPPPAPAPAALAPRTPLPAQQVVSRSVSEGAAPLEEIPLPEPSHVHITLDLPTIQKLRDKESVEDRLRRLEEMLARDGQLLQLLLGMLVRKGVLTRGEIEKIFARL